MLKITMICLGKFKEKAYIELENEYLKRLKPFCVFNIIELPDIAYHSEEQVEKSQLKEAEQIRKHIPSGSVVILLQENGQTKNSHEFASFLDRLGSIGQEITFILGSGVGLHSSLKDISNYYVSLSPLTFPHNLARILLEEQIYRACTIISGKKYHK